MKPKSRLYSLVRNWSQKPQLSVKDIGLKQAYQLSDEPEKDQLENWAKAQELSFELVLCTQEEYVQAVIMKALSDCKSDDVLRLFNDGVRAAGYWYSFAKPTPLIFPMQTEWLLNPIILNGIQNALLNCHLPIGLIQIGLVDRAMPNQFISAQSALIKLQRMGILLHLFNFEGEEQDCQLIHEHTFTHVHLTSHIVRQAIPGSLCEKKLIYLIKMIHEYGYKSVAGPLKLLHDKSVAKTHGIDCYYGPNVMPAMTLHQVIKLGRRPQQKTIAHSLINKKS